ncbi:MAG: lytic murein transglycosylase B [Gammaproteobacteria bacterium]|nr:lytic murein transglycosylase B [Gammaproteobacteria bacterium]
MKKPVAVLLVAGALLFSTSLFANPDSRVVENPIIKQFITDMVKKHGFKRKALQNLFAQAEIKPEIIDRMNRPAEAWPWYRYRKLFLTQERIEQGVEFWRENKDTLQKAEDKFGVAAEIVVAILGVETKYGRIKGTFRLLDSLTTLVVDYPKRSKFFKKELEQFLLLAREEGFDPLQLTGSYAGAMGKSQFIASSYRHYAIDFNGDGVRDLLHSNEDAIGSIASYLANNGWERGEPIAAEASVTGGKYKKLLKKGLKPKLKFAKLNSYGVKSSERFKDKSKVALVELEKTEESKEYWVILQNFYAITRYNHSPLYAMAAFQLGENIRQKMQ